MVQQLRQDSQVEFKEERASAVPVGMQSTQFRPKSSTFTTIGSGGRPLGGGVSAIDVDRKQPNAHISHRHSAPPQPNYSGTTSASSTSSSSSSLPTLLATARSSSTTLEEENKRLKLQLQELQKAAQQPAGVAPSGCAGQITGQKRALDASETEQRAKLRKADGARDPPPTPDVVMLPHAENMSANASSQVSCFLARDATFELLHCPWAVHYKGATPVALGRLLFRQVGRLTDQRASALPLFYILTAFLMLAHEDQGAPVGSEGKGRGVHIQPLATCANAAPDDAAVPSDSDPTSASILLSTLRVLYHLLVHLPSDLLVVWDDDADDSDGPSASDEVVIRSTPPPRKPSLGNPRVQFSQDDTPSDALTQQPSGRFAAFLDALVVADFALTDAHYAVAPSTPSGRRGPSQSYEALSTAAAAGKPGLRAPACVAGTSTVTLPFPCDDVELMLVCEYVLARRDGQPLWGLPHVLVQCLRGCAGLGDEPLPPDHRPSTQWYETVVALLNIFAVFAHAPAVSGTLKQTLARELLSTGTLERLLALPQGALLHGAPPSQPAFGVKCGVLKLLPRLFGSLGAVSRPLLHTLTAAAADSLFDRLPALLKQAFSGPLELQHEGLWLAKQSVAVLSALAAQQPDFIACLLGLSPRDEGGDTTAGRAESSRSKRDSKSTKHCDTAVRPSPGDDAASEPDSKSNTASSLKAKAPDGEDEELEERQRARRLYSIVTFLRQLLNRLGQPHSATAPPPLRSSLWAMTSTTTLLDRQALSQFCKTRTTLPAGRRPEDTLDPSVQALAALDMRAATDEAWDMVDAEFISRYRESPDAASASYVPRPAPTSLQRAERAHLQRDLQVVVLHTLALLHALAQQTDLGKEEALRMDIFSIVSHIRSHPETWHAIAVGIGLDVMQMLDFFEALDFNLFR